jgi:CheY-like chemotaxis protein
MIQNGGQALLGMIDDLLDFSMIEDGSITFMRDVEAPDKIIQEILYLHTTDLTAMGLVVNNRLQEETPPSIRVDRNRFRQIMIHIISNAIKYNKRNGRIDLWSEAKKDGMLRIYVADTGEGIHRDRLHQVFQPFNRLGKEHTDIEGTGIGLAISKKLAEMMNGSIGFTSEYGTGSTFWVEFPISGSSDRRHPVSGSRVHDQPANQTEEPDRSEKAHLILYIEDNPVNMLLIEKILERQKGFRMLGVSNAEMGIELARERRPEVILMDINLPGMNGYEAVKELKKYKETADIPVIAVSANVMATDIEKGRREGFSDYLVKPLDIDQLMVTINRHVKKRDSI